MDRFIEDFRMKALTFITNLKSNMDRFIVLAGVRLSTALSVFKIQYG